MRTPGRSEQAARVYREDTLRQGLTQQGRGMDAGAFLCGGESEAFFQIPSPFRLASAEMRLFWARSKRLNMRASYGDSSEAVGV